MAVLLQVSSFSYDVSSLTASLHRASMWKAMSTVDMQSCQPIDIGCAVTCQVAATEAPPEWTLDQIAGLAFGVRTPQAA